MTEDEKRAALEALIAEYVADGLIEVVGETADGKPLYRGVQGADA